ncbi:transposase [Sphingomonas sp.]|uniref:transposase n=1 Tax=Sphingomonas sp. TaxID=28214 RepID=UPI001B2C578A|nr:transposase [Sphingomonas sp.]MBO9715182.1 transposase [Sphingomonas sp.]
MPRLIDVGEGEGDAIGLDELFETLDASPVDVRDEDAFASLGPLLARLGRNRSFLADLAAAELEKRCARQSAQNGYGAQVLLLRPPGGRYLLRANFWPAAGDAVTRASGAAAFFYGMPHDHNFPFLTHGYFGPGYWSDYYDYDVAPLAGLPGEAAGLRFVQRARLEPGQVMLYRMRRDIHVQLPPDSFSVSLNIMGADPAQPWLDQYRFDVARGTIAEILTHSASEALVAIAAHLGGRGGELAAHLARTHPCDRMRAAAVRALAAAAPDRCEAHAILARAAASPRAQLAGLARGWLTELELFAASA